MAEMATVPVFACRGCGKPLLAKLTSYNDEGAKLLKELMSGLSDIALCKHCKARYNYLALQGRSDEFHKNPTSVIYNVIDNSGNDYYRKNG